MKLRIAKKIFATSWGCRVQMPNGQVTWIGESRRYSQDKLMDAVRRIAKVKKPLRFKYMGHPAEMWS